METLSFLLFLFMMLFGLWLVIQFIVRQVFKNSLSFHRLFSSVTRHFYSAENQVLIRELLGRNRYYGKLPAGQQELFFQRVADFILSKEFIPRNMSEVTPEQKVSISASAIQLTFGINQYLLEHFGQIIVFPHAYYSRLRHEYHKGETNLGGVIVLSAEDLYKGEVDPADGINLGLHEMAHALKFELLAGEEVDDLFTFYYQKWQQSAAAEYEATNGTEKPLLRNYANTNADEFFAVCVENFFERPAELRIAFPELFEKLKVLLNQDPEKENPLDPEPREVSTVELAGGFAPVGLVFSTRSAIASNLFPDLPYLLFTLFVAYKLPWDFTFWMLGISTVILIINLLQLRKFEVYQNCMAVRSLLFPNLHPEVYDYQNVEYITASGGWGGQVTVRHLDRHQVRTRIFKGSPSGEDLGEFKKWLVQFKVRIGN